MKSSYAAMASSKMMNDDQILEVLHKNSNQTEQEKCQALVDRANELGGKDNTTVILIQVQEIL